MYQASFFTVQSEGIETMTMVSSRGADARAVSASAPFVPTRKEASLSSTMRFSAKRLIEVTRESFFRGIKFAKSGYRISDIGAAIQEYVEGRGYSVIRDYVGHGVGHEMHEAPEVPNYDIRGLRPNPRLVPGMTIAIEPMVAVGDFHVKVLGNDWTVVTVDGSLAAHYENTICITDGEPEILTMAENID